MQFCFWKYEVLVNEKQMKMSLQVLEKFTLAVFICVRNFSHGANGSVRMEERVICGLRITIVLFFTECLYYCLFKRIMLFYVKCCIFIVCAIIVISYGHDMWRYSKTDNKMLKYWWYNGVLFITTVYRNKIYIEFCSLISVDIMDWLKHTFQVNW